AAPRRRARRSASSHRCESSSASAFAVPRGAPPPARSMRSAVRGIKRKPDRRSARGGLVASETKVIVIAGPTASGKSALALDLAAAYGGTVVNADSLQLYRDLRILSARPDAVAEAQAPHRLYGILDAAERGSVARWRRLAEHELAAATE